MEKLQEIHVEKVDNGYIVREGFSLYDRQQGVAMKHKTMVFQTLGGLNGYLSKSFNLKDNG